MFYALTGFIILMAALTHYFVKVKQSQTPKNPILLKLAMFLGSALSIFALTEISYQFNPATLVTLVLAANTLLTSVIFVYFLATKATPIGDIKVKVGDSLPAFNIDNFDSNNIAGKRVLLKFYRGSWCPYCSAELIMFEQMTDKLAEYGVQVIALSNDTSQEQALHIKRDNLTHTLISDPELQVIRQYGVEHHKGLGATAEDTLMVFGITMPLPWKMRFKAMAIPTSLLIDETGKIVWIDQSDDYRLRASEQLIMSAVTSNFKPL